MAKKGSDISGAFFAMVADSCPLLCDVNDINRILGIADKCKSVQGIVRAKGFPKHVLKNGTRRMWLLSDVLEYVKN